jgi:hypothetical protein
MVACIGSIGAWESGADIVITEILPPGQALGQVQAAPRGGGSNVVNPEGTNLATATFAFEVDDYSRVWFKNTEGELPPEPALEVSKTAETLFTRTYKWGIEKTADFSELGLAEGESGSVEYEVVVSSDPVDSGWGVRGTITIKNVAAVPANVTGVTDAMTGESTPT